MPIKLFDLSFLLTAKDLMTPVLRAATQHVKELNQAAKSGAELREYSANLAMLGGSALAAGGALAGAVGYVLKPAVEMQAEMSRVHEAINDGADTMKHLAEAQAKAEELSAK